MTTRELAMKWWNSIVGNQYPMVVKHSSLIIGGTNRHPTTLTGSEIELIYKAETT